MNFKDFADLGIDQRILDAIAQMGFENPTPVQEQTIPLAISGCDLLVQAPTGTGKTAAFGIPVLNMIDLNEKSIQAVILCPTRELTMQIAEELKKLSSKIPEMRITSIYGGQNIEHQLAAIRKKPHIIVGTTGRVMDHMRRGTLKLHDAKCIVLDEADEMLSMGFRDDIDIILKSMMRDVQKMLFSATVPKEIMQLSATYQNNPMSVKTTCDGMDLPVIKQFVLPVSEINKYELMKRIITDNDYHNVLVFCNTKIKVDQLNDRLNSDNYLAMALHGDLRQRERDKVMKCFRAHNINMLIATDVCARGIDVDGIEAIFNYDIPLDEEYYVHRIGRTARANRTGIAYSFMTGRERNGVTACEKAAGAKMELMEVEGLTDKSKHTEGKAFGLPTTRFFLNVGERDGATQENIVGYLTANTNVQANDIYDIKLKDIFSFVEVDGKYVDEMLGLNGNNCFKRRLAVEVCAERGQQRGGSRQAGGEKRVGGDADRFNSNPSFASGSRNSSRGARYGGRDGRVGGRDSNTESYRSDTEKYRRNSGFKASSSGDATNTLDKPFARTERQNDLPKAYRSERPFNRADRAEKPFVREERVEKPFVREERAERPFNREERAERPFNREERAERPFNRENKVEKPFNRENNATSRNDIPARSEGERAPRREYGEGERAPRRNFRDGASATHSGADIGATTPR
ncbi:MAG: DEAD/DEAH box helicase, partial [Clostridia bacterium]